MSQADEPNQSIPTSAITFVETDHGRLRRRQRGIHKKDLKSAKKYGTRSGSHPRPNGDPTAIYRWKDIVYITNERTGEEVTSYAVPFKLDTVPISEQTVREHNEASKVIQKDKSMWNSNTVIVVDTSGSMKRADVWGSRTRLDSVWISVALDFIATRIETGAAGALDVVSVISMGEGAYPIIEEQPTTWVLYNQIVDIYNRTFILPKSHGNYIPSLELAEQLLHRNSNESCAVGICFVSDGKPSDHVSLRLDKHECADRIMEKVASLSKRFGRRMQFDAVGIGSEDDFGTLEKMVNEAKDYGVKASLNLPSMSSSDLGDVLHSFATSITSTQTEMTNVFTNKQQKVRDVKRESRSKASKSIQRVSEEDFFIYEKVDAKRMVYNERQSSKGFVGQFEEVDLQNSGAEYVALNQGPFGEGAERFAFRFYELDSDRTTIVGKPLVAKESRFILEDGMDDEASRMKFVKSFCKTQQLAGRIAKEFNDRLDYLHRVDKRTPKVEFLDCSVYQLNDINLGKLSVLVEEKLDHNRWYKWNANNGYVEGMKEVPVFEDKSPLQTISHSLGNLDLGILEECEEEEEESDDDEDCVQDDVKPAIEEVTPIVFSPSEVAQAFSHFSYWATGRKRLICDIQGVFCEEINTLRLSDPVIHYYNHLKEDKRMVHGRTDRGHKGIQMFFDTHKCSKLCYLVNRGFKKRMIDSANRGDRRTYP